MMNVTRSDIEQRVRKAGQLLKRRNPVLPIKPAILLSVADTCKLPIGSADLDKDIVARTVVIAGFVPEAKRARDAGIDGIFRVFQHGTVSAVA